MPASTNAQMGGSLDPSRDLNLAGALNVVGTYSGPWGGSAVTATGATGTTAADLGVSTYPAVITVTGASGAGINLNTGAALPGAFYYVANLMTGVLKIYSVGATINGATGTTAVSVTATGNLVCFATCSEAGKWQVRGNT